MTALGWSNPQDTATITVLLRHGDTRLSPEHRFSGLSDEPLSADGTRQVNAAAHRLACGAPIDAIVSSPLKRAAATAAIVADELGLTAAIDDDLRETDFGEWEGFTLAEIQDQWPEAVVAWQNNPEQAPPGGESFADTASRVNRACERILGDHQGETVLVVSHITPIKILLCRALGAPLLTMYRFYLGSACINEIQWHGNEFAAVRKVNDTSHLIRPLCARRRRTGGMMTYEVGLSRTVRAFHVMPGMPGPEGQRHHHDYRIEVVVERQDLDDRGMVCDLDLLEASLADLTARIEDKDLEDAIQPPDAEAITVEVFARWAYETLAGVVRRSGGETLALRVWESPTAFGGYHAAVSG